MGSEQTKNGAETQSGTEPQQTTNAAEPQSGTEPQQTTTATEPQDGTEPQQTTNAAEPQSGTEPQQATTASGPQNGTEPKQTTNGDGPQSGKPERRKKKRFFTVFNIIGIVLCVLLLPGFIISTTLLVSSWIHSDLPPSCFGYTPLIVETGSMSPVFDEDDLVLVHNSADDASYNVGDIICFHSGNVYVTHRIKEITSDKDGNTVYVTQGDANNAPDDGAVSADQILGVYKTRLKGMGKVFLFVQTPLGMIVCVMLPIILVLLLFLVPPLFAARRKAESETDGVPDGE